MSQGPESRLVGRIRVALDQAWPGSFWTKIHGGPFQAVGLPDLIGCVRGRFAALEVKLPGEKHGVTPLQARTLSNLIKAGAIAGVAHSVEEALDLISTGLEQ